MSNELTYGDLILGIMYQVEGFDKQGILNRMIDESEVEHQISCHADTLPQNYRHLASLVRELTDALQKKQDIINQDNYNALVKQQ